MEKIKLLIALIALSSFTIGNKTVKDKYCTDETFTPIENSEFTNNNVKNIIVGTWKGEMNGKKIIIVIENINNNVITGFNSVGTNKRILRGTFAETAWDETCAKAYLAILKEPGDDKWDGVFKIKFVGYQSQIETDNGIECKGNFKGTEATGEWKSNNGKMKKSFNLIRKN